MIDKKSGAAGEFLAKIIKVRDLSGLKVSDFVPRPAADTPGNVAICLSGGGSRAMTAGMGQLLALKNLAGANGKSLLGQTKAISTVSGGSWVGTTFEYLTAAGTSDNDYLGTYTPPSSLTPENIDRLPESTIGFRCTKDFSILDLLVKAFWLWLTGTSSHMLWQTLIGIHILEYYNLFAPGKHHEPNSFFTYNQDTGNEIIKANPSLAAETVHLIAAAESRVPRGYVICNMSMSVTMADGCKYLAPVQSTAFFTGIISTPSENDPVEQSLAGGGGVTSFAFNSDLESVDPDDGVTVEQSRQFALVDAVGTSSAAFAETLIHLAASYSGDIAGFMEALAGKSDNIESLIKHHIRPDKLVDFHSLRDKLKNLKIIKEFRVDEKKLAGHLAKLGFDFDKDIRPFFAAITAIVPQYKYWPIADIKPNPAVAPSDFADAGSLDNTGITAVLTYADIDNIIAFVNSDTPLQGPQPGQPDNNPEGIPNIIVSSQIPPLFGYQPYDPKVGYKLYKGDDKPKDPIFKFNQVFPSEDFPKLLQGLWEASGSGSNQKAANFPQTLTTVENRWFGVKKDRPVKVLWVYLNTNEAWFNELSPDVRKVAAETRNFPFYNTFTQLELSKTEVTLLSNLTAWNVLDDSKNFQDMYDM